MASRAINIPDLKSFLLPILLVINQLPFFFTNTHICIYRARYVVVARVQHNQAEQPNNNYIYFLFHF